MKKLYTIVLFLAVCLALHAPPTAAQSLDFRATLSGAQEVSPPAPPGGVVTDATGKVVAKFDKGFTKVEVKLRVDGVADAWGAHFHCARPGQNGPVALGLFGPGPLMFDGEVAEGTLTNADFTGADCSGIGRPVNNIAALAFAMRDGLIYANVHTPANNPGEIRGRLLERGDD